MDEEYFFNEKKSIRDSARTLKKYGSTCNHVRNSDILIRHDLQKTDTLQGIALKYGCTTEQIRRANRLFAQDSLFLRQFLMIPVDKDSPYYPKDDRPQSLPSGVFMSAAATSSASTSINYNNNINNNNNNNNNYNSPPPPTNAANNHNHNNSNGGSKSMDSITTTTTTTTLMSAEEESRKDMNEFLGKIDSNLAESRKFVAKSQKSFDYMASSSSGNDLFGHPSTSSTSSSLASASSSQHHIRNNSVGFSSSNDTIQLLGMTQSRRVQNSLLRLERQQDEFFEL